MQFLEKTPILIRMTIELTQDERRLVEGLLKTGRYEDDRAVLRQSLKLMQDYESRLSYLRAELQKGEDSGDYRPFNVEDTIRRARARHEQR